MRADEDSVDEHPQLWDERSAQAIRKSQKKQAIQANASTIEALLSEPSRRVAFVMSFDEGAILFLRAAKPSKDEPLFAATLLSKQGGAYKLSFDSTTDLTSFNLRALFRGAAFQKFLLRITSTPHKATR